MSAHPSFATWEIVSVDFPYAENPTTRRRPALVIAVPQTEADFAVLWVLMITSARHAAWPSDVLISDLAGTGLSHASLVRPAKIATLDARLAHRIGTLPGHDRPKVQASLNRLLSDAFDG